MKPLDPRTRRLIDDSLAADVPPPELETRLWQTLSTRLDAPLPPTAAAAHGAFASKGAVAGTSAGWLKAIAGVLAIGAGGVAVQAVVRHDPAPSLRPAAVAAPVAQPSAAAPTTIPETPQPSAAESAALANGSLNAETLLLARAQRALGSGAPGDALPWIQQHAARFPNGALAQEREAARVLALCALKRTGEARRATQQFLRAWPSSPLADRVRAACPPR